ncbi:MAG: 50S ribosomal protein L19 [Candidatus Doudnabacteria bacterium RIFCSPHIGHO2_02_FULL_48_21]|uniref:50S ribosomal protein L19 n=1 Tax=Candidatus Doudnabacteria bacterium RIFCSPLOWO2_02_FULL_48_13 TaxID=1817845 RepID=A0A1F5QCJ1_9BACT|nr:MAG: 50S ribosomal protein L19 [Candidatus Doudnabacteria bacterium RIFCSPHIGHO2_01_48_18]OGE79629.1 MAG: 50S ribosomal protein L19 [Candidatus Doudnabacteria bacterium RIFCSPHIGHO2_01_FULL_48_180]OGE91881.1 MAG: 50S ribosomal protein L19 [Candidatus Doudnabacteria bacterium RIFCSPHIGHO2_12_FULL_47_25]OGE93731.1 MAG: 50S ribosomal protein L19 [Candidatus Doudnabacteria bacterium RIFCSPHIGHO2_02_FULL_48_21]OGE97959.1 MAG: 50S ribosomal protein L19 [Candidatus Doudnabacteria bacterium RIFCSPLO
MYIKEISKELIKTDLPQLRSGQQVRVHQKIKEPILDQKTGKIKDYRERVQMFDGQIIAVKHGSGINATITVRKIASGVGVERVFPIHAPTIVKIDIVKNTRARKSKLYYTREGQEAKVRDMNKK